MYRQPAWLSEPSPLLRYSAGVLLAAAAQLVRLPIDPPTLIPFITYIPFMTVSAWFGGFGPGLLTAVLCTLESLYFAIEPVASFRAARGESLLGLDLLLLTGLVACVLFERLRRVRLAVAVASGVSAQLAREGDAREQVLQSIIQNSPAAIALLSGVDFTFTAVNPAYQALALDKTMLGRTVANVCQEGAPLVLPLLRVVRDAQTVYHANELAIPRRRKPGKARRERFFNVSFVPLPDPHKTDDVSVLVVAIEVTAQKEVEEQLRVAYGELAAIYANAPVVLLVVDQELHVEKLNDLGARLTNLESAEVLGLRPGGALGCLNALADPRGCGFGPSCSQCALRLAVSDTVREGVRHDNVEAWIPSSDGVEPKERCYLVSTAPLPFNQTRKALICAQDITGLKQTEADLRATVVQLKSALTEKTVLLQEVHHRVKNNLAVISSLLNMKADITEGAEAKLALEESQRRVHSIALIHEHLYGSEHLDRINFAEYTQQLVQALYANFAREPALIALRMDLDSIDLGVQLAVPAALILNELLSNAFKHAFPGGRSGQIHFTFRESEPGIWNWRWKTMVWRQWTC